MFLFFFHRKLIKNEYYFVRNTALNLNVGHLEVSFGY